MELFVKLINHFHKKLHLRCLTGFWMRLCYVRDNYLSVHKINLICANFPRQTYLLLFFVFSGDLLLCLFQNFPFSMTLMQLHYSWQQNRNKKTDKIFIICSCIIERRFKYEMKQELKGTIPQVINVVSEYEKIKAHKFYIVLSLLIKKGWKNVHGNKNDDFFSKIIPPI